MKLRYVAVLLTIYTISFVIVAVFTLIMCDSYVEPLEKLASKYLEQRKGAA